MEGQNNTRLIEISYSSLDIDAILASFADDVALRNYLKTPNPVILSLDRRE